MNTNYQNKLLAKHLGGKKGKPAVFLTNVNLISPFIKSINGEYLLSDAKKRLSCLFCFISRFSSFGYRAAGFNIWRYISTKIRLSLSMLSSHSMFVVCDLTLEFRNATLNLQH